MAAGIVLTFDDAKARAGIDAAVARGRDMKPALRAMARENVNQTRRRFETSRAPDGTPWVKGRKLTGQTLIQSGLLLRSITDRPPTETSVEVGSNRVYARVHQDGAVIRPVNAKALRFRTGGNGGWISVAKVTIPARPYLGANAEDMAALGAIALRHLAEPMGAAG